MVPLGAIVVDFDGTACRADVSELLLRRFGEPGWEEPNDAVLRGAIGLREGMRRQVAMLHGDRDEMLAYAIANAPIEPTFAPFLAWASVEGIPVSLASDGFAFYIGPILEAAGIEGLEVRTNELVFAGERPGELQHPNAHPECVGCGTCKMLVVQRARAARGPVAFVGEGSSDRYGALYADVAFAKDALVAICERDGVPFVAWETFDDVRAWLSSADALPGPAGPVRCPGWIPA